MSSVVLYEGKHSQCSQHESQTKRVREGSSSGVSILKNRVSILRKKKKKDMQVQNCLSVFLHRLVKGLLKSCRTKE